MSQEIENQSFYLIEFPKNNNKQEIRNSDRKSNFFKTTTNPSDQKIRKKDLFRNFSELTIKKGNPLPNQINNKASLNNEEIIRRRSLLLRSSNHSSNHSIQEFASEEKKNQTENSRRETDDSTLLAQNNFKSSKQPWVKSSEMMQTLERFAKKTISAGTFDPTTIVSLFIQTELLEFSGITTCMLEHSAAPSLKNWIQISDANEFLKKAEELKEKERELLFSSIRCQEIILDLKQSIKKATKKIWIEYVKSFIEYQTHISSISANSIDLPTFFDMETPISSITRSNILLTFELMCKNSFVEKAHFFTIDGEWIPCPNWEEPGLNKLKQKQRHLHFLEWLIGHIYEKGHFYEKFKMKKESNVVAEHAALIYYSPLTQMEMSFLTDALDKSFKTAELKSLEDICFVVYKLANYAVIRLFDIYFEFSAWIQQTFEKLIILKKLSVIGILQEFIKVRNFPLTAEEITHLKALFGVVVKNHRADQQNCLNYMAKTLERDTIKLSRVGRAFNVWAEDKLKEAVQKDGYSPRLIVERYLHQLWYKKCHQLPCLPILQAVSFNSYFHAHKLLKERYPELLNGEAGQPCLVNFVRDKTVWQIHFDGFEFSVTHIKPYQFVARDETVVRDLEYERYGKLNICWTLKYNVQEPAFSAQLQLANIELFDIYPLKLRTQVLSALKEKK